MRQAWRPIRLTLEPSKAARNLAELLPAAGIPPPTRPPALRSAGPQPPSPGLPTPRTPRAAAPLCNHTLQRLHPGQGPGQRRRLFCRGCRSRKISIPAGPPIVTIFTASGRAKSPNSPWRTSCCPVSLPTAPRWPSCPQWPWPIPGIRMDPDSDAPLHQRTITTRYCP
jgi:hypothetical protein